MMPRTLEIHNLLGTLPDILKIADEVPTRRSYELPGGTKVLSDQNMTTPLEGKPSMPYTNSLIIGQNYQEEILREHIKRYGVEVELGTALEDLQQYEDDVAARLIKTVNGESTSEDAKFAYLVGADGARSIVRKKLELSFLGESIEAAAIKIGDIVMTKGLSGKIWHFWGDMQSKLVALRPSGQNPNVYCFWVAGVDLSHVTTTSGRDDLIKTIEEITDRKDFEFGEVLWANDYRPSARMVDKFHLGRVFVTGDAAHCHSPTGAQGMNYSSQDSFNLGWKLALVAKELAPRSLLNTYDDERIPVIAEMLNKTTELMKKTIKSTEASGAAAAWKRGFELYMLGVNYRSSSIVLDDGPNFERYIGYAYSLESASAARAGDRAPDAPELLQISPLREETTLFQLYGASYHTVVVFGGSVEHKALQKLTGKYKDLVKSAMIVSKEEKVGDSTGFDFVLVDSQGHAFGGYSIHTDTGLTIIVVRPDGVIGARTSSLENVDKYFSNIFL